MTDDKATIAIEEATPDDFGAALDAANEVIADKNATIAALEQRVREAERRAEEAEAEMQELERQSDELHDTYARKIEAAERQCAENERLVTTLECLRRTAALLYQNSEACAVNHYGEDFQLHGMPGWLADCARDIEDARALLTSIEKGVGNG